MADYWFREEPGWSKKLHEGTIPYKGAQVLVYNLILNGQTVVSVAGKVIRQQPPRPTGENVYEVEPILDHKEQIELEEILRKQFKGPVCFFTDSCPP